jgi:hypothetical protein
LDPQIYIGVAPDPLSAAVSKGQQNQPAVGSANRLLMELD